MDSPQLRIMQELRNDDDKKFALIINDCQVKIEDRQVFVKSRQSRLVTVIYKRPKNRVKVVEIPVSLDRQWKYLSGCKKFYGFDFSPLFSVPGIEFKVTVNRKFEMLFIESPVISLIKDCIRDSDGRSISSLSVRGLPSDFWEELKRRWIDIRSEFQVDSVLRYNILLTRVMKMRIDTKMRADKHRMFARTLDHENTNFLFLFLKTNGLWNPFLDDPHLTSRVKDSWFFNKADNTRLFVREGMHFSLSVMTVNDFCKSIGLNVKLGFTSESAISFLFSLIYVGNYNSIDIPSESMKGYIVVDRDFENHRIRNITYTSKEPAQTSEEYERTIIDSNGLEAFILRHSRYLGGGIIKLPEFTKILSVARIERR